MNKESSGRRNKIQNLCDYYTLSTRRFRVVLMCILSQPSCIYRTALTEVDRKRELTTSCCCNSNHPSSHIYWISDPLVQPVVYIRSSIKGSSDSSACSYHELLLASSQTGETQSHGLLSRQSRRRLVSLV